MLPLILLALEYLLLQLLYLVTSRSGVQLNRLPLHLLDNRQEIKDNVSSKGHRL